MMFNKFLIVLDATVDLSDYSQVLHEVMTRVAPSRDLIFSRGPADVLDHSSQTFAYGGKLGIDATGTPTAIRSDSALNPGYLAQLSAQFPACHFVQPFGEYPLVFVFLKNPGTMALQALQREILEACGNAAPRFIVYFDAEAKDLPLPALVWLAANHCDPGRDCFTDHTSRGEDTLGMDALSKERALNGFERDWPNPVVMDPATVEAIDKQWNHFMEGPLIPSPSRPYWPLQKGHGAVRGTGD